MGRLHRIIITILLLITAPRSLSIPSTFQCSAVRLMQAKNGTTYSKSFQVRDLFVKFTSREVRVFGIHGDLYVCQKLGIQRVYNDTFFLENPNTEIRHSEPKLYIIKDTLMGNVNLFDSDTSEVSIKVLVKRLIGQKPSELEQQCR